MTRHPRRDPRNQLGHRGEPPSTMSSAGTWEYGQLPAARVLPAGRRGSAASTAGQGHCRSAGLALNAQKASPSLLPVSPSAGLQPSAGTAGQWIFCLQSAASTVLTPNPAAAVNSPRGGERAVAEHGRRLHGQFSRQRWELGSLTACPGLGHLLRSRTSFTRFLNDRSFTPSGYSLRPRSAPPHRHPQKRRRHATGSHGARVAGAAAAVPPRRRAEAGARPALTPWNCCCRTLGMSKQK